MKRRHLLAVGAGALAAPAIARAQGKYPERTVRLVVPFAAAGPTDIIGRKVSEKMTALLGQTMIVDNKSGAAGSIGAVEVKNAKPDGYTLLVATSSTHAINPTAFVNPPYDAVKDFTPISSVCVNPLVLYANRAAIAPEIPTMIEAGVPGYEAYTFNLILGPAGMPQPVVDTLDQASRKLMKDPEMVKFLEDIAAVPTADTTPERTAKFIKDEIAKWAPVIKAAGVKIE